jgi:glycosyltransferase involved in cell wall biosynthesis
MSDILTSQSSSREVIKHSSGGEPFITVIVPVRNEEKFIEGTINELMSQKYPKNRFEVIVADGCSTDHTAEIIRGLQNLYSNLILVDNPGQRSSAGRNAGIRKSTVR